MIRTPIMALANSIENLAKIRVFQVGGNRIRKLLDSRKPQVTFYSTQIINSPYSEVSLPNCTLPELIWKALENYPEKTAMVSYKINKTTIIIKNYFIMVKLSKECF